METLPEELVLTVFKHLSDLKALDAVVRASPCFSNVFSNYATEIFEHLMHRKLHDHTKVLLRAHVCLRWQPDRFLEMQEAPDSIVALKTLSEAALKPLRKEIPVGLVRYALRVFTHTHAIGSDILDSKINALRALTFEHIADPRLRETWHTTGAEPEPAACAYVPDLAPPSWIEEQRVIRALLRISVLSKLAIMVAPRILDDLASNPAQESEASPDNAFQRFCPWAQKKTLDEFREILLPEITLPKDEFQQDEFDETLSSMVNMGLTFDLFESPRSDLPQWRAPAELAISALNAEGNAERWLAQTPKFLEQSHPGWVSSRNIFVGYRASPLRGANWHVLRGLGFGLWDGHRMNEQLQLGHFITQNNLTIGNFMFAWKRLYDQQLQRARNAGSEVV